MIVPLNNALSLSSAELPGIGHPDVDDDNDFVDATLQLLASVAPHGGVLLAPTAPKPVPSTPSVNFLS